MDVISQRLLHYGTVIFPKHAVRQDLPYAVLLHRGGQGHYSGSASSIRGPAQVSREVEMRGQETNQGPDS